MCADSITMVMLPQAITTTDMTISAKAVTNKTDGKWTLQGVGALATAEPAVNFAAAARERLTNDWAVGATRAAELNAASASLGAVS